MKKYRSPNKLIPKLKYLKKARRDKFKNILKKYMHLPNRFNEDMILSAPSNNSTKCISTIFIR